MHELVPPDEPFFHFDLAPGAEAVGQGLDRSFRLGTHGGILCEHCESCQPSEKHRAQVTSAENIFRWPHAF